MNTEKFEEFISQYPIFEYRILDTKDITIQERVRTICQEECERYDSTWACPPAVGTLRKCDFSDSGCAHSDLYEPDEEDG